MSFGRTVYDFFDAHRNFSPRTADLRKVEPWSRSTWSHTDLLRLQEGMVGCQTLYNQPLTLLILLPATLPPPEQDRMLALFYSDLITLKQCKRPCLVVTGRNGKYIAVILHPPLLFHTTIFFVISI
ncbi:hypothetical protein Fcan01_02004 [Folsomia candida]|uniref:Uncharacterized protein n=1 Tax=Folsomia candida TaxID=158441 RepID=A0A226F204_FOLCA|nr:hypothetical protein Fcan01_02004 [Folsomia candida]